MTTKLKFLTKMPGLQSLDIGSEKDEIASTMSAMGHALEDDPQILTFEEMSQLAGELLSSLVPSMPAENALTPTTVHYYRRKKIITAPEGERVNANWYRIHAFQAIAAKLAGLLRLANLDDMRDCWATISEDDVVDTLARLVHKYREQLNRSNLANIVQEMVYAATSADSAASPALTPHWSRGTNAQPVRFRSLSQPSPAINRSQPEVDKSVPTVTFSLPDGAVLHVPADHELLRGGVKSDSAVRILKDIVAKI